MSKQTFEGTIEAAGRGGAVVYVPFDVKGVFGSGRPKVRILFDGTHEYRGSLANMGSGHFVPVRKDVRAVIGKDVGDRVKVVVELDTEPRVVVVPAELERVLAEHDEARVVYEGMSYTHRREYAEWVGGGKKVETRERRALKAVEMLMEGKRL